MNLACADFERENPHQHPLFATDKEHGPTCLVVNDRRESLLERFREAELFARPEFLTSIYTSKWIKLYGAKYVTYNCCIVAVDATFADKIPTFGKLLQIWLIDNEVIFEFTPFKTVEFNHNLLAYEVEDPGDKASTKFCFYQCIC